MVKNLILGSETASLVVTPLLILVVESAGNWFFQVDVIDVASHGRQPHIIGSDLTAQTSRGRQHRQSEVMRKADIKWVHLVNLVDILLVQAHAQGLDIALDVLDLATTADGKDVGGLVHDVCERDTRDDTAFALGNLFQNLGDLDVFLGRGNLSTFFAGGFTLLRGLEVSAAEGAPGQEGHAFGAAHGDDVTFKVAVCGGPMSLLLMSWLVILGAA